MLMRSSPTLALLLVGMHLCIPGLANCQESASTSQSEEDSRAFAVAISILREGFVRPLAESVLDSQSIAELMQRIDPDFGDFKTKEDLNILRRRRGLETNAFGLSLRRIGGETIAVPRGGGPAALAGLQPGDKLEELAGKDAYRMELWELHELLSSAKQRISLTVRRGGSVESIVVNAAELFNPHRGLEVEWPVADILLLRPPELTETTLMAFADALLTHWRARSVRAVILDLRGNSGGSLDSAVGYASTFLPSNSLVATLRSNSSLLNNIRLRATRDDYARRGVDPLKGLPKAARAVPLAVLIDESTSSGAEMIAAAIQSYKRGVLIGRQTGGVASIQTFSMLPNGSAIRYTSAYWEPPSGQQVNDVGLRPDRILTSTDPNVAIAAAVEALAPPSRSGSD